MSDTTIDAIITKLRAGKDPDTGELHITEQEAKSALYDLILKRIESCPERGFGVPKTGTPDHAKGTFTKLIAEQEVIDKLKELFDGV